MKDIRKQLFNIIEKSKEGTNFNSEQQYKRLELIIRQLPKDEAELLYNEWWKIRKEYGMDLDESEFNCLHISNGGFITGGDDSFYTDFGAWVVAQGEELLEQFKEFGVLVIASYIINNKIDKKDYMYECMEYAFTTYLMKDEMEEINKQINNKKVIFKC